MVSVNLVRAMRLDTLPPAQPLRLAVTGAGGKSSLLFHLAWELLAWHQTVILTTSTHLAFHQARLADRHTIVNASAQVDRAFADLPPGVMLITGPASKEDRYGSPGEETLAYIAELAACRGIPILVEADGSRMRLLKAPAAHEPAIPPWAEQIVVIAGLEGVGKPMSAKWVHRPERFAELSGTPLGSPVTPQALTTLLTHPEGGLKGIPNPGATPRTAQTARRRQVAFLNTGSDASLSAHAAAMRVGLLTHFDAVVTAGLLNVNLMAEDQLDATGKVPASSPVPLQASVHAVYEPVAGIVLAAGSSSRFSASDSSQTGMVPKQLLPWKGEPFVRTISAAALAAGLSPVVVVTGSHAVQVSHALEGLPITLAHNPAWSSGQASSLAAGVAALPSGSGAAVFLLADQPQVPVSLLQSLVEIHAQTLSPIIAPQVAGQRANPVLFDRTTFANLCALQGDVGGRALFSRYPVTWLPWLDEGLLLDVDTRDDYQRLLHLDG